MMFDGFRSRWIKSAGFLDVGVVDGVGNLRHDPRQSRGGRCIVLEHRLKGPTLDVLHHEEAFATVSIRGPASGT